MGQLEAAKTFLRKAEGLYAGVGDHVGLAEVATNFAILAMSRNDTHRARSFLLDAFREAELTKDLTNSDRAEMYTIKGNLAARDHSFAPAVLDYQQAIDFWTRARGPKCYPIALEYAMQADAYRELGDYNKAEKDITAAVQLLEETVGRNTGMYAAIELTDARLLRATGATAEAAQRETEAKALLKALRNEQCANCSVSSTSFR
jgi:tetratricopeptide (TPR) repeat protein